jgi:hypothetical protein
MSEKVLILGAGFGGLGLSTTLSGRHLGQGTCYIEFGGGRVGSVDIDFLSGPSRRGSFNAPSAELVAKKEHFGSSRRARWFG